MIIMKFVFIIIIVCWSITANNAEFPISYINESLRHLCEDELITLDFSDAEISQYNYKWTIKQDFISGSLITCLNLMGNIQKIERGAFNKLSNLTHLYLFNNRFDTSKLLNFGDHYKLQVLIINNNIAMNQDSYDRYSYNHYPINTPKIVSIFDKYPNLEILSLRNNSIIDLNFSSQIRFYSSSSEASTIMKNIPFPKLKSLDLSENYITQTGFLKLLPNSLYFLDLHNNLLKSFNWEITSELFALNLDNNRINYININNWSEQSLSVGGLKNLHYLSVSRNNITKIAPTAFQNNNKLFYLNLSVNDINYIHPETFANLQYLKILDLSENQLENVPQISNEIGISTLYFNYNNITKLMSRTFVQMSKLTTLLLRENQIDEIDVDAFDNLSVLEELDLSSNMLSSLPEGWTESLVSLKYLDLSSNQFTSLESLSLPNTLSLTKIYLMLNPLEYLNVSYFKSLLQNFTIDLINKSNFTKWMETYEYKSSTTEIYPQTNSYPHSYSSYDTNQYNDE